MYVLLLYITSNENQMNMKRYIKILMLMAVFTLGFNSCIDQPDAFELADGVPTVHYVRYANSDEIIEQAFMGEIICFVGENLRSVRELWFNDQQAILNTSYMTKNTLVVAIPNRLAKETTDKAYMITKAKDTLAIDFKVMLPFPIIKSMSCEFQKPGEEVTIYGNYFTEPMTVDFVNTSVTTFKSVSMTEATFVIPEGTLPGKVKVTTLSGVAQSPFMYLDNRGLITDFDGTTDIVPQGWNINVIYSSEGGIKGNYVQLGPSDLDAGGSWNEDMKLPFWCGNWNGDPMSIKAGPGTPICNIIDMTDFSSMGIKFELCIPAENPWSSGALQIVFTSAARCANDAWQNNTYIRTSAKGGLDLCRALYRPWEKTGEFHTDGKWITVTIPFSEFIYNLDGTPGKVPLSSPEDFASLIFWVWEGGMRGKECTPIFRIDNIRAVSIK